MSVWKRIFGRDGEAAPTEERPAEAAPAGGGASPDPAGTDGGTEPVEATAEERLEALGEPGAGAPDPEELLRLFDDLCAAGRELRAIDLARRVLGHHPRLPHVCLRVAHVLAARGDDEGAYGLLEPMVSSASADLAAVMLAAEVTERRGDEVEAAALYERVLARDLDYPRARERVERLRELREPRRELAGATLLTDGALARGRYRVQKELGRGGAGTIFLARDGRLARVAALKVYHRRGRVERQRLRVEARTPARFEHPGVVRIFDLDEELGAIVMEWVRRGAVRREIDREPVPLRRVRRWLATALEAIGFIHARGIVHRDLKPSNFLLRDDDRVVLTDFGLALEVGAVAPDRGGGGEGTLAYMPPEQRAGEAVHPAADVHAFGASMREILGCTRGEIPPELLEVAAACMRREPADRPTIPWILERLG